MAFVQGRLPTIPEYYREKIDSSVDLTIEPKQCCPFHKEDTPSWSYSPDKRKWRCFGSCKIGGGVIELHQANYKLASRAEAEKSLKSMCGVKDKIEFVNIKTETLVDSDRIRGESLYQEALMMANNPSRWLELDYLMSKTPLDITELKLLVDKWKGNI